MEAGFSPNAATPAPAGSQDLIGTVSAISSSLMNEVSKVIIGKNEIEEWGVRPLAGAFGWGILFIWVGLLSQTRLVLSC